MTVSFDSSADAGDDPRTADKKHPTREQATPTDDRDRPAGSDPGRDVTDEDLDLDIHEQGDGDRLKEGFTGQER